jgi:DNA-binding transcriptional ArsR family regulator
MTTDYTLPTKLDRLVHNPSRLAIMAVLAGCERADFTFLEQVTELNKGTLSKGLTALEEAGYVEITKEFKGKMPNTSARLTSAGRKAFKTYSRQYQKFLKSLGDAGS